MKSRVAVFATVVFLMLLCTNVRLGHGQAGAPADNTPWTVPKVWNDEALAALEVPLADASASPVHVSADYYYRIPSRAFFKSYPVYAPGREPAGYMEWLKQQEPQTAFDASTLKTEEDWVKAGQAVFEGATGYIPTTDVRDPQWFKEHEIPVAKDGTVPFFAYVVRKKGQVEMGMFSCSMCHTRVLNDGTVIKGAQGNFPMGRLDMLEMQKAASQMKDVSQFQERIQKGTLNVYSTPWLQPDPNGRLGQMTVDEIATAHGSVPPGVQARFGTSPFYPVPVPDLIGVKDRRYLDRTGLVRHRSIEDLMLYEALNQGAALLDRYGKYVNADGKLPEPGRFQRYSDEQIYAIARYLYSLTPPPNPNKFDATAARGKKIFEREGCASCHTPPLYTNNKLTPAEGFRVPDDHLKQYDILPVSVGTDPGLAMKTRRGTGYYKVPSLRGLWYRGPFEHNGSVATLEDWFDPRRLSDSYEPTGFKGFGVKSRAVKGHPFGLKLSEADRKALIAFLRTL